MVELGAEREATVPFRCLLGTGVATGQERLLSLTQCQLGPDGSIHEEERGSVTYVETQRRQSAPAPTGVCTDSCGSECTDREPLGSPRMELATVPSAGLVNQ